MIRIGSRLRISPLTPLLLTAAYFCGFLPLYIEAYLCAAAHEAAHIAAARRFNIGIAGVEIHPFGLSARLKDAFIKSPAREAATALAGPLASASLAGACAAAVCLGLPAESLLHVNLGLALINLLPCLPLDGGRVLKAALVHAWGGIKALNFTIKLSRIIAVILLILSAGLMLVSPFNFSPILIAVFLLGGLVTDRNKSVSILTMRQLIYNDEKLSRSDITDVKITAAHENVPARRLLRRFSYHRYYIIHAVDSQSRVSKILTETQLLNAMVEKGIRVKIREIDGGR